jgi:hypothetical protein
MLRFNRVFVVFAVALSFAVVMGVQLVRHGDDDAVSDTPSAFEAEQAVTEAVQRFVAALAIRDTDALYDIQEESYKRVCRRDAFESIAEQLRSQPLEGPVRVAVRDDVAAASLLEVQPDGSRVRVAIQLARESDGTWRLTAPSRTGCTR